MASAQTASQLEMAVLRANGLGIPLTFRMDGEGKATVTSLSLSLRFSFQQKTINVEEEVFDKVTSELTHTIAMLSNTDESSGRFWKLGPGRYRVYGLTDSHISASTEILTPRRSSTCTIQTPLPTGVKVKVEPGTQPVITFSSDEDSSPPKSTSQAGLVSIVACLKKLGSRPGSKNPLKNLDFNSIRHERVDFLPPKFDGDVLFEFPPAGPLASQTQAKAMQGMDKRYDGHIWTKTITTNIMNDMGLRFRTSKCVGHLRCENKECEYLHRTHRISPVNETEFDGLALQSFAIGQVSATESTFVCKVCKEPPSCLAICDAKIYYVTSKRNTTRACIHLGSHKHPVKIGDYRDTKEKINSLIGEQLHRTPLATKSSIVLEASKDLVGEYLLRNEDEPNKVLSFEELVPVLDRCKDMGSPSIRNRVVTFRYLKRYGVMDSITKLRGLSNWAFVQKNMFPGQGEDSEKVFVFKMSEVGPGSGVDLVRRMQEGGDLENAWMMFDHVKRVKLWTTMACHVYDSTYCRVMSIACCDMQSEDADAQLVFWKNLNAVMARHNVAKPQFKGFMADSAQANWNAVRIIYGSGNKEEPMEDRERTCQFHWTQSMVKYTEKYIAEGPLRDQHKSLCQQYRKAKTMEEAETLYQAIRAWWATSGAVSESALSHLELWLAFWHFRYRQWGGFMTKVR
jgi:hypothetical protein